MSCVSVRRIALLASAAALIAAAPASADKVTYGSDLSGTPTISHNKPNDAIYWNEPAAGGSGTAVGVTGQVIEVQIKGHIVRNNSDPFNTIHFQVLRPGGDGKYVIPAGGTSTDYLMPFSDDDNQITTWTPTRSNDALCVKPGDRVDFATLGGFQYPDYQQGTPFKVFASVPGTTVEEVDAAGTEGINNGQTVSPMASHDGEELLMRFVVGTGADARYACQTPEEQKAGVGQPSSPKAPVAPLNLRKTAPHVRKDGTFTVSAMCHADSACVGALALAAKNVAVGTATYNIPAHKSFSIHVRLNAAGRKLFKKSHNRLTVAVTATTAPGGGLNVATQKLLISKRT